MKFVQVRENLIVNFECVVAIKRTENSIIIYMSNGAHFALQCDTEEETLKLWHNFGNKVKELRGD